ncbi:hypothetical protein Alches_21250 [Alicyclobacillus hesperidum subsp. aegles]|nr:hypothetical protein [Alicyclobacillus hesperidum]GLG02084.1 hypothetical protein Alches_21250 [Alicyclobacillus hesperidum subsp. aegles]
MAHRERPDLKFIVTNVNEARLRAGFFVHSGGYLHNDALAG